MDGAAIHRLCLLELVEPDAAVDAAAAALAALPAAPAPAQEEAGDARIHALRVARAAVASQRRRQLGRRLLHPDTAWRAVPGEDMLAGLHGRERSVLALELGVGTGPTEIAELLDVAEDVVLRARGRALERLRADPPALHRRADAIAEPKELGERIRAAAATRRRRDRLDPRRLLTGGAPPLLAAAALIAVAVGAGAGLLAHPSPNSTIASLVADRSGAGAGPPGRAYATAGYDPVRSEVVLFGGRTGNRLLDDTWTWDGNAWRLHAHKIGPSAREAAAMAWDESSRRLLLFGGQGTAPGGQGESGLRDTWAWDGEGWTPLHPSVSPPGRLGTGTAALATDATTGEVVLVTDGTSREPCSLAVWHWSDGWLQLHPRVAPRPALTGRLAYAPGTGGLVLVTARPTRPACGGDATSAAVWTWDGVTWTEQHPVTPLPARHVVEGGLGTSVAGVVVPGYRTFHWDGSDWHDDGAGGPGARVGAAVAYDQRRQQSVLFGGCCIAGGVPEHVYDDTWTWSGESWLRRGGSRPPGESPTGASPSSAWVEGVLPLGAVGSVAADRDSVFALVDNGIPWTAAGHQVMVARLDRASGGVTIAGPFTAADSIALAGGRVWVGSAAAPGIRGPALRSLDLATMQVERELDLPAPPGRSTLSSHLAGTEDLLWFGRGSDLLRIDPRDGTVLSRADPAGGVDDVAVDAGGGRLYVSARTPSGEARVTLRDPHSGATRTTAVENATAGVSLAADDDGVWISVPAGLSATLHHLRANDLGLLPAPPGAGVPPPGDALRAFAVDGLLWLADPQRSTLSCADPHTGEVRATASIADGRALAGDPGGLYLGTGDGVVLIELDLRCAG